MGTYDINHFLLKVEHYLTMLGFCIHYSPIISPHIQHLSSHTLGSPELLYQYIQSGLPRTQHANG